MSTNLAHRKIIKDNNAKPEEFELHVAQALVDLELNATELKSDLRQLYIKSAKRTKLPGGKEAIVVFVPYQLLAQFHKVQQRLVRELEKKFSGAHVVLIAQRRILAKPTQKSKRKLQKRPVSRTLTSVHNAILDDIVYPAEITGKRIRVRLDGTKLIKVHLDQKEAPNVAAKLDTFRELYRKLTGKKVSFEIPSVAAESAE
eukprot:TRINITY_DN79527_c0_g1_i1.p1 TRINITY_DN79527_c0_g1~~TRINITY_DN79527_c0_g1_i1.p1  ORF type:complete len:201 (+),score=50.64 TRINITY_DN79527_c0_g1_i1:47-649(+)